MGIIKELQIVTLRDKVNELEKLLQQQQERIEKLESRLELEL